MFHVVLFSFHSIYYSSPFSSLIHCYVLLISIVHRFCPFLSFQFNLFTLFHYFYCRFALVFFVFHNLTRLFPFFLFFIFLCSLFFLLIFNPLNYIQYNKSYIEYNIPRLELYTIVNSCKHVVYK